MEVPVLKMEGSLTLYRSDMFQFPTTNDDRCNGVAFEMGSPAVPRPLISSGSKPPNRHYTFRLSWSPKIMFRAKAQL